MKLWPFKKSLEQPMSQTEENLFGLGLYGYENYDPTRECGELSENSIVASCLSWAIRSWSEADWRVEVNDIPVEDHPLLALLEAPNAYQSGDVLFSTSLQSLILYGNGYWYKDRNVFGSPFQLWNISARNIKPVGKSNYIDYYEYTVNGKKLKFNVEDIIHFRMGEDPDDPRLGFSALRSVIREIAADNSASLYNGAIMKNGGMPSILFSPKDGSIPPEQAEAMALKWKQKYGKEKQGLVGFLPTALELLTLGFSPDKMNVMEARKTPEERICSVLGISPIVLNLGAGLANSTYANYTEAKNASYENFILPIQAVYEAAINRFLMPELVSNNSEFKFDNLEVRALQEDENKLAERVALLYSSGVISKYVAKEMVGLEPDPGDELIYSGTPGVV